MQFDIKYYLSLLENNIVFLKEGKYYETKISRLPDNVSYSQLDYGNNHDYHDFTRATNYQRLFPERFTK